MKGVDFEGSTFDLIKPVDMTDEQCGSLPAMKGVTEDGYPYILVAFQPSIHDLASLQEGGKLFLKVLGNSFAPVALYTMDGLGNINQ
jgi:hypothetical protein